ncbi:MAG: transcriptional repressor LexA [Clostridia bacterium]|nr:transcriptional repressor LexA [Clostridia bacterium]MBQ3479579.1 transcriptional repressor LexA [Clostridia bacterium]MBQ6120726.1 transcriptional repressor LexA [Clostridia bacterium]MBQ6326889.1 transcriptional repressor LexA [Clostridia bacterium]MBQ8964010.1 transcriptional repressor LexA [Clostridia bacterium]
MRASHENQQKILDFIKSEIEDKGYPPSVREICAAVGLRSTSTVHAHLNHLEAQGLIRRDPTKPRALEVVDGSQPRGRSVPLVGRVTAGQPILAIENIDEYLTLPQSVLGQGKMFCLRVEGESMIDAGIMDGDLVVLRQQDTAENGEIVVAMNDEDEATLKRIYYEADRVRLQPENPTMAPIYVKRATVLGKLVALIRQF